MLKKNTYSSLCLTIITVISLFFFLIYPSQMLEAGAKGLTLWFQVVFPSLFPFLVGLNLLIGLGIPSLLGKWFAPMMGPLFHLPGCGAFPFVMGIVSGFPAGAKITAELYKKKEITLDQAQQLMTFSNNPGPLFVIGTVGVGLFQCPAAGYYLLSVVLAAAITTGLLNSAVTKKKRSIKIGSATSNHPVKPMKVGNLLNYSIKDAIETITQVGGFIILFSVITKALSISGVFYQISRIIHSLFPALFSMELVESLLTGMVEMTNGAQALSSMAQNLQIKIVCTAVILGWGGLSVLAQTFGVMDGVPISPGKYVLSRFVNSLLCGIYSFLFYPVFLQIYHQDLPVAAMWYPTPRHSFHFAFICFIAVFLLLLPLNYLKKNR